MSENEEQEIVKMPPEKVEKTAKNIRTYKAEMDKARGEVGQYFKQFEEEGGHKKALKTAMSIADMESVQAQEFWRCLIQYMDDLGVFEQQDLFDDVGAPMTNASQAQKELVH